MKKYIDFLFSMRFTAILFVVFGVSIAVATFIENDYGTESARAMVYNARWFELVMVLGMINMLVNIFRAKLYQRKKLPSFLFHLAFAVIILGAGITRYIGFEGVMSIREGASSNTIISDKTYIQVSINDGKKITTQRNEVFFSPLKKSRYQSTLQPSGDPVKVILKEFIHDATESLQPPNPGEQGVPMIEMVVTGENGRQTIILKEGEERMIRKVWFSFNGPLHKDGVRLFIREGQAFIKAPFDFTVMSMADQSTSSFKADSLHPFLPMQLYNLNDINVVPMILLENGVIKPKKVENAEKNKFFDALVFEINRGGESREAVIWGKKGMIGEPAHPEFEGLDISISYGAMAVHTSFSLRLEDFFLERYPGSNSPSWFESKVTLFDPENKLLESRRIFMNNVLIYKGYRFYQSSYETDEKGTVLSVNKDFWGTWVSYLGYFLMALGMVLSIFNPNSRFKFLSKQISILRESRRAIITVFLGLFVLIIPVNSQKPGTPQPISPEHARLFGEALVQDHGGRIEPVSTLSSEILRKVSRKTTLNGLTPDQVFLGMLVDPGYWQTVPMIRISNDELARQLNLKSKYASIGDFINEDGYILGSAVEEAYRKKPAYRSKLDNELLKVDERINICYLTYTFGFLRVLPREGDESGKWYNPTEAHQVFSGEVSDFTHNIIPAYLQTLGESRQTGNYAMAEEYLDALKKYQKKYGAELLPGNLKTRLELFYNKANIFERLSSVYGLVGFILLILHFVQIFVTRLKLAKVINIASWLVIGGFALHTAGLAIRWYISGHAPWSNGYEALVYISWATILAGLIFSRKSKITLAATAILAYLILHVAHLSWMDPEITNLVPVLKSYWLVIHVAIITASYGFLALGAVMAAFNLVLMFLKSGKNLQRVDLVIEELSHIIEMTLIVGLFMVAIGTFLGGVWANESWGRYWGWDAKETWALVTVIVYSFIAHMRLIPGLKGVYAFNLMALVGFSSVIMTYFGVNYYLSGLHSYAAGDPLPVPAFVYYTVVIVSIVGLLAYLNHNRLVKSAEVSEMKDANTPISS